MTREEKKKYLKSYQESKMILQELEGVMGAGPEITRQQINMEHIFKSIMNMPDGNGKMILTSVYINGCSLRETAGKMHYSYGAMKKMHSDALDKCMVKEEFVKKEKQYADNHEKNRRNKAI